MNFEEQKHFLTTFVDRWTNVELYSTGAQLVNFSGPLYNVDGSSSDPNVNNESWKGLLLSHGIDAPCYVSNETPSGNSHPSFSVGGHMTTDAEGQVETGDDTYLMPLCSWHNSKARDGVAFHLERTLMLKLSGFMQSEIPATFMARLPSEKRHSIVYTAGDSIRYANLSEPEADAARNRCLSEDVLSCKPKEFVLLERIQQDEITRYRVKSSSI